MFKNIIKSICWLVLYFVSQVVSMIGIVFFDAITGRIVLPDTQDADQLAEELVTYVSGLAVPSLLLGAVIFIIIFLLYKLIRKHEFDIKTIDVSTLLGALGIGMLFNVVLTLGVNLLASILPDFMTNALENSTSMVLTGHSFWLLLLGTGILTPILEELTFRYGVCGTIGRKNPVFALIISSIIFGLVHLNPIQIAYATLLGFVFGVVYLKSKNIWYPIAIHAAINSSSVIASSIGALWVWGVIAVLSIVLLVVALKMNPELKFFFKKDEC